MKVPDVDQREVEAIEQLVLDFKSLGYWVATRNDLLPEVLAFKAVNGNLVAFAAEYATSRVGGNCMRRIFRNFRSGFNVLIATPNETVKAEILRDIRNQVSETMRRKIVVVVIRRGDRERKPDEIKS
jgi:hypothetical protein